MDKKALQRQRVMRYLIDAAKKIIRDEGDGAVTVRKVADLAGYSYATIYNYFADVNELLWYAAADFLKEAVAAVEDVERGGARGVRLLKEAYRAYVSFYLANPAVYRLAFFRPLGEPPQEVAKMLQEPVFAQKQAAALAQCAGEGLLDPRDIQVTGEVLTGFVHGLLLFYFADRLQLDRDSLFARLDNAIDFLLRGRAD